LDGIFRFQDAWKASVGLNKKMPGRHRQLGVLKVPKELIVTLLTTHGQRSRARRCAGGGLEGLHPFGADVRSSAFPKITKIAQWI